MEIKYMDHDYIRVWISEEELLSAGFEVQALVNNPQLTSVLFEELVKCLELENVFDNFEGLVFQIKPTTELADVFELTIAKVDSGFKPNQNTKLLPPHNVDNLEKNFEKDRNRQTLSDLSSKLLGFDVFERNQQQKAHSPLTTTDEDEKAGFRLQEITLLFNDFENVIALAKVTQDLQAKSDLYQADDCYFLYVNFAEHSNWDQVADQRAILREYGQEVRLTADELIEHAKCLIHEKAIETVGESF